MTFSIIVVCLNAGKKLQETVESIRGQTEQDYEIIIKDGDSTDEVTISYLSRLEQAAVKDPRIKVYRREKDTGIYDGMNQAVRHCSGDYIFFLNCGDCFFDEKVLWNVREQMEKAGAGRRDEGQQEPYIFYGSICERLTGTLVQSNPKIDDFACYRNVPCHQACFYAAALCKERGFQVQYRVRADYEHFLWCRYRGGAKSVYMPVTVASYEGGGFSETRENRRRSRREHKKIVVDYLPAGKVFWYRTVMILTLAPLRTWIARNPCTAGIYQSVKKRLYSVKG